MKYKDKFDWEKYREVLNSLNENNSDRQPRSLLTEESVDYNELLDKLKGEKTKSRGDDIELDEENEETEANDKETDESDAVPYTMQDELMQSITETTKAQFGANYSKFKTPMLYYPEDGDVTLSGEIASLNDAKFQYRYKDSNGGCYIWTEPLQLNDDNLKTLSVVYGVYKNWKNELVSSEDIKPMSLKNGDEENNTPQEPMVPGDDIMG